mgnify:FL=1
MKLLRVTAQGLPLFKEKLDLSFYAQQRVAEEDKMNLYSLFSNIYLNPANAFIGINASGKTSVLKVLLLALGIINNEPINHMNTKYIRKYKKCYFECIFLFGDYKRNLQTGNGHNI